MVHGWGKNRRLSKLKRENYFLILAMDHALSNGPIVGIESVNSVNRWITFSQENQIPAVVLNHHYIQRLKPFSQTNIVVQTMGLTKDINNINKVPLSNINDIELIDGTAISIQINFEANNLQEAIQNITTIVSKADKLQYPILFMVGNSDWQSAEEFNYAIRVCAELGADLIKIHLPSQESEIKKLKAFSNEEPALLLAGGENMENFETRLHTAKKLGFQGICLGRNIFQNETPQETLKIIHKVFKKHK